ncbi:bifunctional 3-deoxy-7-phosphoheptulonate synthase/chorismate mutase type II [Mongoliibacter ruber]|uniref:chorismate mutase n=1 Tax=Mongoliibacter ruber TaxID=1750599 RepID=A0A2T0WNJ2_9BACT|nr:bifunctional 3-deoxy-7-phosphoheptulonate synthase/chorismate mutase type II [Mongoliibacter ruber]PRY88084.1 3-deoxy-D-arabinoheptulosonate-7-phosphate synthase [Mongoliibacter ruber]
MEAVNNFELSAMDRWEIGNSSPLIIAGPCSVETPQQLDETVRGLVANGVKVIRGGVWKPRTRPNSFEGVGHIALPWIKEIKEKYQVKFAIEVASPYHVEKAFEFGIDLFWIGARTSVNPFAVQEIADSLKGVDIPVLVKNPVNPDLALWIGALERINQAGIKKLGAIHRGFSNFNDQVYRNSPTWQIPLELKTRYPNLPILNDPSHICGRRDLLNSVAQMAMDLNFDGLIIESHVNPDQAWSDAAQQVTPEVLGKMIAGLHIRKVAIENPVFQSQLDQIREQIDQVDRELLEVISRRVRLVEKAGEYKKLNNVAIFQIERWKKVFESRPEWGKALQLNHEFVKELYQLIHTESIKKQEEIMEQKMSEEEK